MDSTGSHTLKRTFEESGLGDDQVELGTTPPAKGQKLLHIIEDVKPSPQQSSLDTLPTEILSHIASHLSTSELLSLRLANRTIEVQLFNDFAAYYFAKKQFMLTAESLQCLLDISLHPKLSTVLEHVIISLDKYAMDMSPTDFRVGDQATEVDRCTRYRQGAYDQAVLLASGRDRDLLTEAFRNLRNLKTVGLRDYNSGKRWRDGDFAEWRAYGASTVWRKTGMNLLRSRRFFPAPNFAGTGMASCFAARAFSMVLHALGASGATLEHIELLLRDKVHGLPDYAFHIPKSLEPAVAPMLGRLKSLLLTVDLTQFSMLGAVTTDGIESFTLVHFLSLAPNITHLRLNFQNETPTGNVASFLDRLAATDVGLVAPLLPKLAQLDFGMMLDADPSQLCRVVGRWGDTLTGVSFWKVSIRDSHDQEAGLQLEPGAKPNWWAELLVQLPKTAPKLCRITVGCLTQYYRHSVQHITLNAGSAEAHSRPAESRTYGREEMLDLEKFRQLLDEELMVMWPRQSSDEDDSEGDSGGEESDNGSEDGED